MAKQVTDIRDFINKSRRKDAKYVKVLKAGLITKFKLRTSKYLYTLKVTDKERADKISASLPQGLEKVVV